MWIALVPSGMEWLDAEIGGLPAAGVVAALGAAGTGKTTLALGFARAQLQKHGRVCYLTSETPEAVIETCRGMLELDLRPHVAGGALTILSYAQFFVNKVRSLSSVDQPLDELREFFEERGIEHVVIDTLDPMLAWIEPANAKASVRRMLGQMHAWGRAVLCTLGDAAPAATELARMTSGSLELAEGRLVVRQAGWCNAYDVSAPVDFVQGHGAVVRGSVRVPTGTGPKEVARQGVAARTSEPEGHEPAPAPGITPWTSLIGSAEPRPDLPFEGHTPMMPEAPSDRGPDTERTPQEPLGSAAGQDINAPALDPGATIVMPALSEPWRRQ